MMHIPFAPLAALLVAAVPASVQAGAMSLTFGGSNYVLTSSASFWGDAEAEAVRLGGHLVAINSAEEQAALVDAFGGADSLWIGLNDEAVEGTFVWSNGQALGYTHWAPGEPNNLFRREDHVVMYGSGLWNDFPRSSDHLYRGIVEVAAVPEPGSLALVLGSLALLGSHTRRRGAAPRRGPVPPSSWCHAWYGSAPAAGSIATALTCSDAKRRAMSLGVAPLPGRGADAEFTVEFVTQQAPSPCAGTCNGRSAQPA